MNRSFQGIWIPKEIWLKEDLSIQAKCLWAEIQSLHDEEKGGCYASDEYLMKFLGVKKSRLHEVLKELKDANLVENVSFNGRQRILKALSPNLEAGKQLSGHKGGKQVSGIPESRVPENRKAPFRNPGNETNAHTYRDNSKDNRTCMSVADDPVGPPPSKVVIQTKDSELTITQDDLYRNIVNKRISWTADEISYAWDTLTSYKGQITSWWAFIEGTVEKYRMKLKSKRATSGGSHRSSYHKPLKQRKGSWEDNIQKNSTSCKENSSDQDMSGQASVNLGLENDKLVPLVPIW